MMYLYYYFNSILKYLNKTILNLDFIYIYANITTNKKRK